MFGEHKEVVGVGYWSVPLGVVLVVVVVALVETLLLAEPLLPEEVGGTLLVDDDVDDLPWLLEVVPPETLAVADVDGLVDTDELPEVPDTVLVDAML